LPGTRRSPISPAIESLLRETAVNFSKSVTEILSNAVAGAADDALERIEDKVEIGLGRLRKAREVARERTRRGKRRIDR
jgi:hypothetical protein